MHDHNVPYLNVHTYEHLYLHNFLYYWCVFYLFIHRENNKYNKNTHVEVDN